MMGTCGDALDDAEGEGVGCTSMVREGKAEDVSLVPLSWSDTMRVDKGCRMGVCAHSSA